MNRLIKTFRSINEAIAILSGALIFMICFFAVYEVIARSFFNQPTKWSLAFSQFMLLYAIFLGSSYCFQQNGHIRVDIVLDHVPQRIRSILTVLGLLMAAVFVSVLGWKAYEATVISAKFDYLTITTIQIPSAYLYVVIFIGSILMLITMMVQMIENIKQFKSKEGDGK